MNLTAVSLQWWEWHLTVRPVTSQRYPVKKWGNTCLLIMYVFSIFMYFSLCPSIIGHVNIGIAFICSFLLEIPNDASLSQFWLAVQHSRQEYCKLIGWYWKIMRRQLWTLACPIVYLAGRFVVVRFWVRTKFFMMRVAWPPVPLSSPVISSCACIHTQIHAVWGWPYHQICPS